MTTKKIEITEGVAREVYLAANEVLGARTRAGAEGMLSSAELWLTEAQRAFEQGQYLFCARWSLRSLEFSEGIMGGTFRRFAARFSIGRASDLSPWPR